MENTFHYPPELFNLLVDAIPLLNRSKRDILIFFRGSGVSDVILEDLNETLRNNSDTINKYGMARSILTRLNEQGDRTLRERREILRRIVDFTNFDSCWPDDQLKVKGLVASIREVINHKDSFTRMNQAREEERQIRLEQVKEATQVKNKRREDINSAKEELYSLFNSSLTPQNRGKKLENAMNNLFQAYGILVQEAFYLIGSDAEGIVEQIDGVINLKGALYFIEMKWCKDPIGKPQISEHLVRLMSRAEGRGLFISASGYTDKVISLIHLQEIVYLLEAQDDLEDFLIKKINAAQTHKNPYFKPLEASV
jgi:restriction system protein